ncbi:BAG family molecular chaperone regulator 4-like [Lycium ferocissimum]|uniref:BAG family molecular chaperone regulator 4-like n=1 Tax=Lycium ferocissimum TaxID=112874 RepID=UPI002814BFBC|nr:BAG family molecular chaperone regulator 4-like [Lycium ferocissimum]
MWKKSSISSKSGRNEVIKDENKYTKGEEENKACIIDWEVRPGGLLVQKRVGVSAEANSVAGPMIKIKVSYDSCYHDIIVPAESTFGNLKTILCDRTGLHPNVQRLLFQGKEKDENECLHIAGVKDMSKVILMEDPASKEMKKMQSTSVSCEAIARVKVEVDKLSHRVVAIEEAVKRGTRVEDRDFVGLTELLMIQLLTLDSIEAEGEARAQRKKEVHRIQSFVDMLDNFKARNSNFVSNCNGTSTVTTKWETFGPGVGSLTAPNQLLQSTKITQNWEVFD